MSDLKQAAQQALESLNLASSNGSDGLKRYELRELDDTIAELYAALAQERSDVQPEPEPVLHKWAALFEDPNNDWQAGYEHARRWVLEVGLQSIATPPQRKPLTDDQINAIVRRNVTITDQNLAGAVYMSMRELEAAHGIQENE